MAKKAGRDGVNKSQAIRDYLKENPTAGVKDIVSTLAAKGITISVGLASNIKYGAARAAKAKAAGAMPARRGRPPKNPAAIAAVAARVSTGGLTAEHLLEAKKLVDQFGGADRLRAALETLEKLR